MGLLSRLFAPPPVSVVRVEPQVAPETRRGATFAGWGDGWGVTSLRGARSPMQPHLAEGLSSVLGCVELIAGAIASLPATLTQDAPDGQVPAPPTATAWGLLRRPNPRQSWPACISSLVASSLLQGNGVGALQRDGRGAVTGLVPVPWPWLAPIVIQGAAGPRLVYDVVPTTPEASLLGLPRRLLDSDVMHLRARSDEGVIGRSVLSRAAGVVREGTELHGAAEAFWRNGLHMSGFIETGGAVMDDVQRERFKAELQQLRGSGNVGKTMLLQGSLKYTPLSLSPEDAQLLSTRQFSVAEMARLFCIPEPILQMGNRVPASLDPYLSAFAQLALAPLVAVIEAEFDHAILPPGIHLQLDMAGLQRGNFAGQVAAFCAATQSGITTPNDARRGLGWPAHADGDALRPGNAPAWPADAKGVPHMGPSPGRTDGGLPAPGNNGNGGAG